MSKVLSPQQQIEILQEAIKKVKSQRLKFLCPTLNTILYDNGLMSLDEFFGLNYVINEYIPLFTRANADRFGTTPNTVCAWWYATEEKLRIDYLKWMIKENKKLIG